MDGLWQWLLWSPVHRGHVPLDLIELGLLTMFHALKAVLLRRESRLGWSLSATNALLAGYWAYVALFTPGQPIEHMLGIVIFRGVIALAALWADWELIGPLRTRPPRWLVVCRGRRCTEDD